MYRCDRCGTDYGLPPEWPHAALKNQAVVNNHVYGLCKQCATDLQHWIAAAPKEST
jgi:hypothetical protein